MMAHDPILNAFARVVAFRPDATLLWSPEAAVRASELDAFARRIEARLASSDIGDAALIALQAPNGPIFAAALLALRRCDRAVALLDERTPGDERRRALAAFGAGAVVRGGRGWDLDPAEVVIEPTGHPAVPLPAGTAFVKLTSGSTGSPRGIAVSADALVADDAGLARTMGLVADERILAAVPVSHSYGLSSVLLPTLVRGSMMVVPSDDRTLRRDRRRSRRRCHVPADRTGVPRGADADDGPAAAASVAAPRGHCRRAAQARDSGDFPRPLWPLGARLLRGQ